MSTSDGTKTGWAVLAPPAAAAILLVLASPGHAPARAQGRSAGSGGRDCYLPGEVALVADGLDTLLPVATWARVEDDARSA